MKKAVICFTRVPKPGLTKTRLLGLLSGQQCARLHWAFLRDLAEVYSRIDADLFISHTPAPDWESLKAVFPRASGFFPQEGAGLGERMHNAIARVLSLGYDSVVLTGADLPRMTQAHLQTAFEALKSADVAIGPTPDGGYYLIGMKQPHPEVFQVSNYGSASVYESTLHAVSSAGLSHRTALCCGDVDTPGDLRALYREIAPESATGQCIAEFIKEGIAL